MHPRSASLVAALLVLSGSGCSQQQASSWQPARFAPLAVRRNVATGSKGDVLYVPELSGPVQVNSYLGSPRELAKSLNLQSLSYGVVVDAAGNVYAATRTSVLVYTRLTKRLIRTISRNLKKVETLAVASNGTLYVADREGIAIFPNAQQIRMKRIRLKDVFGLATDAQSNVYAVLSRQNAIYEYAAGSTTLLRTITNGISAPVAVAFDTNKNMYVANIFAPGQCDNDANAGTVTVYAPKSSSPLYTITAAEGLCSPRALTFDGSGNLYVANYDSEREFAGSVTVYSAGTTALLKTITDGIGNPQSVAIDAAGKLYVANFLTTGYGGDVTVYAADTGSLVQTISDGLHTSPDQVIISK